MANPFLSTSLNHHLSDYPVVSVTYVALGCYGNRMRKMLRNGRKIAFGLQRFSIQAMNTVIGYVQTAHTNT